MGTIKVEKEVSNIVEEVRYVCDLCPKMSEDSSLPFGWAIVKIHQKLSKCPDPNLIFCEECLKKLLAK